MNNVMNRKMFRPRNARNKLNAMGGIMASSAPLMQTVQKFAHGSTPHGVRPQTNPAVQKVIANNLAAQQALNAGIADMPATNLVKQDPDSQGLYSRLVSDIKQPIRSFVGDLFSPDPEGRIKRANTVRGIVGLDPISGVGPKIREGIQTVTGDVPPEFGIKPTMTSLEEAEIATQGSDQLTAGPANQPFDDTAGLDPRKSGLFSERDLLNESPESLDKSAELPMFMRTDKGGTEEDVAESQRISDSLFSGDLSVSEEVKADQPTTKKKNQGITEQVSPTAVDIVTKTAKISTTDVPKSTDIIKKIGATIQKQLEAGQFDEAEEGIAKATGIEERAENESSSRREMVEKERELIAEFLGVDPNEYKKDRGLALAEAAFRFMQTGDIGEAGQVLTARNREINAAQRQQTQAINAMAYKAVTGREETKADRDFRAQQAKFSRNHDFKMLAQKDVGEQKRLLANMSFRAALNDSNNMLKVKLKNFDLEALDTRLNSEMLMLNKRLENATNIANAGNTSAEIIAQANRDSADARAMISGMGDGIRLAMLENSQKETPLKGEELTNFISSRSKEIAVDTDKFGPGKFARVVTDNAAILLQNDYADNYEEAIKMVIQGMRSNSEIASQYAAELEGIPVNPENDPTIVQVTKDPNTLSTAELKNLWDAGKRHVQFGEDRYPIENPNG